MAGFFVCLFGFVTKITAADDCSDHFVVDVMVCASENTSTNFKPMTKTELTLDQLQPFLAALLMEVAVRPLSGPEHPDAMPKLWVWIHQSSRMVRWNWGETTSRATPTLHHPVCKAGFFCAHPAQLRRRCVRNSQPSLRTNQMNAT